MVLKTTVIVGGGAAGFFAAISCVENFFDRKVIILEKSGQLLSKVRISGGGRCNVTHACFDPKELIKKYPRGQKELLGPFHHFQPKDTIEWFKERGVTLKTEEDGRMFPITDSSETIVQCLINQTKHLKIEVKTLTGVDEVNKLENNFLLKTSKGDELHCDHVLLATGSNQKSYLLAEQCGHQLVPPVPSLFTFNTPKSPLLDLPGISVSNAKIKILETGLQEMGPLLITHWGFSGPAILRLSAWGARILHQKNYQAEIEINWLPQIKEEEFANVLKQNSSKQIGNEPLLSLPRQLWKRFLQLAHISEEIRVNALSKKDIHNLQQIIQHFHAQIDGKTTYKQEFVTSGGISLNEINFKTMESRLCKGLFFAGEILDIDGVTGGFNFQNAWTTGWIAGKSMI